jgi:hypothetical protein
MFKPYYFSKKINKKVLGRVISNIERIFIPKSDFESVPIWIIGPPRSGSTLLYNTLVNTFEFTYISNFVAKFPYATYLAACIEKYLSFKKNYSNKFDEGDTQKLGAPHEGWNFLYRWFPEGYENVYLTGDHLSENNMQEFRRNIQALVKKGEGPFILKNTFNSMRIGALYKMFPKSLFIVCQRERLDIAQSIFKMRKATGNPSVWVGAAPKEYNEIKSLEVHEQIVKQIHLIYKQIAQDKIELGLDDRMIYLNYKDFCMNTTESIQQIRDFLEAHNLQLNQIHSIPTHFKYHGGKSTTSADYERFKLEINKL